MESLSSVLYAADGTGVLGVVDHHPACLLEDVGEIGVRFLMVGLRVRI